MAMSKRARSRGLRTSEQMLGAGFSVKEYGVGVIGPDPRGTAALIILGFAAFVVASVIFLGIIIIPGFFLMAAIFGAIDRPASFALSNQGLAVLARSEINGRPRKLLTVLPEGVLTSATIVRSRGYVHLPDFHLWIHNKEYERLLVAPAGTQAAHSRATPFLGVGVMNPVGQGFAPDSPAATSSLYSPGPSITVPGPTHKSSSGEGVIFCSWCGKERAVNAQAIHHCGSMERPVAFCMSCGIALKDGAAVCTSCGTPATQTSR